MLNKYCVLNECVKWIHQRIIFPPEFAIDAPISAHTSWRHHLCLLMWSSSYILMKAPLPLQMLKPQTWKSSWSFPILFLTPIKGSRSCQFCLLILFLFHPRFPTLVQLLISSLYQVIWLLFSVLSSNASSKLAGWPLHTACLSLSLFGWKLFTDIIILTIIPKVLSSLLKSFMEMGVL